MARSALFTRGFVRATAVLATALALAGSILVLPAQAWDEEPTEHWAAGQQACADVMFLGVRGSGEDSGWGGRLDPVRDGVKEGFGIHPGVGEARSVREVYLDYPAAAVSAIGSDLHRNLENAFFGVPEEQWTWHYLESIDAGVVRLRGLLAEEGARCPDEKWVLAGYSQGALVINLALAHFADYSRFGGVFLLANPGRHAGDPVRNQGTAPDDGWGVGTLVWRDIEVPTELAGVVVSECDAYDAICDTGNLIQSFLAGDRTREQAVTDGIHVHESYQPAKLKLDSQQIVQQLMGMAVPVRDAYEVDVEPGEEYIGTLETKPLREGASATWRVKPGSQLPPGAVTQNGLLMGTDGSFLVQVPEGRYTVRLEVVGEFEDHAREVTLTIRAGAQWQPVAFEDPALEACVRAGLLVRQANTDLPSYVAPAADQPLMPADVAQVRWLTCPRLTSLEGLQWASQLSLLDLDDFRGTELSPLAAIDNLREFGISSNLVTDLSPLAGHVSMAQLTIGGQGITDLAPLAGMTRITNLSISDTNASDFTPLAGMPEVMYLSLQDNGRLQDVGPLAGMAELTTLTVAGSPRLTSVAPLASLTKVRHLDLSENGLTSLDGLENLAWLESLTARRNDIVSLSALRRLSELDRVTLQGNAIESLEPLASLTSLTHLDVGANRISDLTPVSKLPHLTSLWAWTNRITDLSMFAGNTVTYLSAQMQLVTRDSATVGDSVRLPVIRGRDGRVLTPKLDDDATGTLTGDPATGMLFTFTRPGYSAARWSQPGQLFDGEFVVSEVVPPQSSPQTRTLAKAPTPTISGTAKVGSRLTAKPGKWKPAGVVFGYRWLRGGSVIDGATSSSYVLVGEDAGKAISVEVTGSKSGYVPVSKVSKATKKVSAGTLSAPTPKITGSVKVGSTLSAKAGGWKPAPVELTYQWYRSGKAIAGATGPAYELVGKDKGKKITVKVSGSKPGYAKSSKTSKKSKKVAAGTLKAVAPTIDNLAPRVGETLTASAGAWGPGPVTVTYQWYRSGKKISKATQASYTLTASDSGKQITVKVTGKKSGYKTATKTSAKTAKVAAGEAVP